MPTINPQIRARHEAAGITEQENRRPAVLLRVAQSLEHVRIGPRSPALGKRFKQAGRHGRHDVTWGKRVDPDAVLAPFGGEVAAELEDGGFGGVVGTAKEKGGLAGFKKKEAPSGGVQEKKMWLWKDKERKNEGGKKTSGEGGKSDRRKQGRRDQTIGKRQGGKGKKEDGQRQKRERNNSRANQPPISHRTTHTPNEHHASRPAIFHHNPRHRLRRHKHPRDINPHHLIRVLPTILQRGRLLLNPRRGNQSIHPALLLRNPLYHFIKGILIAHVDAMVSDARPKLLGGALGDCRERRVGVLRRVRQNVDDVHARAGFQDRFGLREADAAAAAGDEDHFVLEREELGQTLGAVKFEGLGGRERAGGGLVEGAGVGEGSGGV